MMHIPSEIRLAKDKRSLILCFDNIEYVLPAEFLRVLSPSAEVRGHGVGQEVLQVGKKEVLMVNLSVAGQYALKITFSDGHDSGLYDWHYLYELCQTQEQKWQDYLAALTAANQSREASISSH